MEILFLHSLNNSQKADLKNLIYLCENAEPTYLMFDLSDPESSYLMAYEDGQLACALGVYEAGEALECVAATSPQKRQNGLLSQLLSHIEKLFPERDIHFLTDGRSSSANAVLSHLQCPLISREYLMEIKAADFKFQNPAFFHLPPNLNILTEKQEDTIVFRAFLSSNGKRAVCAGTCFCSLFKKEFCIWGVEVKSPFRRQGIGRNMILFVLSTMFGFSLDKKRISQAFPACGILHVEGENLPAINLYRQTGFSIVREIFYYLY